MEISDKSLAEFKKIYYQEFHVWIDDVTAKRLARQLLSFVKAVYGNNVPKQWKPKIDIKSKEK